MLQQGLLCLSAPTEVLYVRGCSQMMASPEGKRGETNAHFRSSIIKPSLEICLVIPKERKVTLRVDELAVPGCEGTQEHNLQPFVVKSVMLTINLHMGESRYLIKMMMSFMNIDAYISS